MSNFAIEISKQILLLFPLKKTSQRCKGERDLTIVSEKE